MPQPSKAHPLEWLLEPLLDRSDLTRRRMFGCEAVYVRGLLVACLAAKQEPWNGLLCPVERASHDAILLDFPVLVPHPVLGKWLYLSRAQEQFEQVATAVIARIADGDIRFGIEPKARARRFPSGRKRSA